MIHQCSMCPFFSNKRNRLLSHLVHRHKNSPNFIIHCNAIGCGATFQNIVGFRKHCQRKHGDTEEDTLSHEDMLGDPHDAEDGNQETIECDNLQDEELTNKIQDAQFVLNLKVGHNLSHASISGIMMSTGSLLSQRLEAIKEKLVAGLPPDVYAKLDLGQLFEDNAFQGLESEYLQEKFFTEHFGYVKPCSVKLGEVNKTVKQHGQYRYLPCEVSGYYVPFLDQLSQLLSMPEVQTCLANRKRSNFEISDVFDGEYLQNEYFVQHPDALLFSLYHDDFEIANPIGAHRKKHKLSIFYWSLLNIYPEFRFKLQSPQLLAVAKTCHAKTFGFQTLLRDFTDSMQKMYSGYEMTINGVKKVVYGTLLYVTGDTPAAQMLGGFKEGVGFAEKPCRTCEVKHTELNKSFSDTFVLRDETEHRDRCELLQSLSKGSAKYWSVKYGITKSSVLLQIPGFCVTKCILHDPMHILLEGIVKMEIQFLLKHCTDKKYFTLRQLNTSILNFSYTAEEVNDKPQTLEKKSLERKNVLPMTAVETLNFMTLLPFLIGEKVPDDDVHWQNFIRLIQITHLIISPVASLHTVATLRELIYTHNRAFKELYPNVSFTPKMHYLTHFPNQIRLFGPGRNHWCLRFEAKHAIFKNKKWKNFKNIPQSVAFYHQRWMCLQQMGHLQKQSEVYLYQGDKVQDGITLPVETLEEEVKVEISRLEPQHQEYVLCSKAITVKNITYRKGSVLLLEYTDDLKGPLFAVIDTIYIVNHSKFLLCTHLEITEFHSHINAFECIKMPSRICINACDLSYKWPQTVHAVNGNLAVMLKNVDFAWCL